MWIPPPASQRWLKWQHQNASRHLSSSQVRIFFHDSSSTWALVESPVVTPTTHRKNFYPLGQPQTWCLSLPLSWLIFKNRAAPAEILDGKLPECGWRRLQMAKYDRVIGFKMTVIARRRITAFFFQHSDNIINSWCNPQRFTLVITQGTHTESISRRWQWSQLRWDSAVAVRLMKYQG